MVMQEPSITTESSTMAGEPYATMETIAEGIESIDSKRNRVCLSQLVIGVSENDRMTSHRSDRDIQAAIIPPCDVAVSWHKIMCYMCYSQLES